MCKFEKNKTQMYKFNSNNYHVLLYKLNKKLYVSNRMLTEGPVLQSSVLLVSETYQIIILLAP